MTANWDPEKRNTFAEEIAHLHEELSEAFRAWRQYKDCQVREVNGKLEGVPIEFADALIGMFYNAELHGFDLLAAVEQKHQFNLARNYVAEGRQLHASAAPAAPSPAEPRCSFTPEIAAKLIRLRDVLARMESSELVNEAWHTLYSIADPEIASFYPWTKLEEMAALRTSVEGESK